MSLTKENLRAFLERENVSDFINLEDYAKYKNIGIYYCRNGYRGFVLELYPSVFSGLNEHETIVSAIGYDFPIETAIDIHYLPSRNIDDILNRYKNGHNSPEGIKNPHVLSELISKNVEWVQGSRDKSLINSPIVDIRPRNHRVILSVSIPPINQKNQRIDDDEIVKIANITIGKLQSLNAREIEIDDFLTIFNEMISPNKTKSWNVKFDKQTPIYNHFLSSEDSMDIYEKDDSFIVSQSIDTKKTYTSVLTTKTFPSKMNIIMAQSLFFNMDGKNPKNYFAGSYFLSLRIVVEDKEKLKKIQLAKSQANTYQTNIMGEKIKTYFPILDEVSQESVDLISKLNGKNEVILKSQWTMVLNDDSIETLYQRIETIKTEGEKMDWIFQQETEIAQMLYLSSLMLMYDPHFRPFSKRFQTTLKSNNGAIAPLYKDVYGMGGQERGMLLFGRQGQVHFFDNFEKGRSGNNIVVAAGTRSGKTFMITNKILQDLACGRKSVFIELDETLMDVVENFGGEYLRFDEKEEKKCLNFFTDIKTTSNGKIDDESLFLIVPLVGLMINWSLDSDESKVKSPDNAVMSTYVKKAVRGAFEENGRNAGMAEVYTNLELIYKEIKEEGFDDKRLRDAVLSLEPYAKRGEVYYDFFNGQRNVYFSGNNLIAIGLAALKDKGDMFSIVLMALTQAIISEFYDKSQQHIEKILYVDEAWSLLENPIFVTFLIRVWRTINKYNGSAVAISQDINQYFKTPELEAIYNNSTYKIFFQQPRDVVDRLMESKKIPEDEALKEQIVSMKTVTAVYSEMMIYTNSGMNISRVISNKYSFYLITNADNGAEVFALMKKIKIQKYEAAEILAYRDEKKCSLESSVELFYYRKGKLDFASLSEESTLILKNREEIEEEEEKEEELTFFQKIYLLLFGD